MALFPSLRNVHHLLMKFVSFIPQMTSARRPGDETCVCMPVWWVGVSPGRANVTVEWSKVEPGTCRIIVE